MHKYINEINHKNELNDEKHMIISTDIEKALDKIQWTLLIKLFDDLRLVRTFFKIVKAMYKKSEANIILNGEKLKQFHWSQKWDRDIHYPHSVSIFYSKYYLEQ